MNDGRQGAIIKIPVDIEGIDVKTGDVHPIVMVNALQMLSKYFARELVAMAEKEVGKNPKLQEQYFDRLTKKYLGNNPNDIKFDPNLFN
jgi:hypothetical protein